MNNNSLAKLSATLVLIVLIALGITGGCNNNKGSGPEPTPTPMPTPTPTPTPTPAPTPTPTPTPTPEPTPFPTPQIIEIIPDQPCTIHLPDRSTDSCAACARIIIYDNGTVEYECRMNISGYDQGPFFEQGFNCYVLLPSGEDLRTRNSRLSISNGGEAEEICLF